MRGRNIKALRWTALASVAFSVGATAQQQDASSIELEEIVVTADRPDSFGAEFVQAGTFRNGRQIDTPLTISVITEELLLSQQALTVIDALRNSAGVTTAQINPAIYSNIAIRGIPVENRGNWRLNGSLPIVNLIDLPLENKARVEALKGASALYYGFSTPSGIVNLVSKRASKEVEGSARLFGNGFGGIGGYAEVGGTAGTIGALVSGLYADLDNGIDVTTGKRAFASGAFDWRPSDAFTLLIDAEYIYKTITEPSVIRLLPAVNGVSVLPPLRALKENLGSNWMKSPAKEYNLLARAEYRFSPAVAISFDAGLSDLTRDRRFSEFRNYNLTTGAGTLLVELANDNSYRNEFLRSELAAAFATGPFGHEIVLGLSRNQRDTRNPAVPTRTFAQNLFAPVRVAEVALPPSVIPNPSQIEDVGYYVFDRIKYGEWLQILLGIRKTDYSDISLTTRYETEPTSFSVGGLVKPLANLSIYATYIEGLENGGVAPAGTANSGETFPAAPSEQKEIGIKYELTPRLLLTAAYFDIERVSSFTNPANNRFGQDGLARYKGGEFSLTGEVTQNLSIYGTMLVLDAEQVRASTAALTGRRIENSAKFTWSLFGEYRLPFAQGLAVTAGAFHVGNRAVNAANHAFVPGYTLLDLGASYTTRMIGRETVVRLNAENVTGKRYWASTGSSLLSKGLPAAVKVSVSTAF
jgi:iron complex outermembrane recepter protein